MRRVTGREAITLLAEMKAGKKKFTVSDERFLMRQANLFREWLMGNAHLSKEDATKVLTALYRRDVNLIQGANEIIPDLTMEGESPDDFRISPATIQRIETGIDPREHPDTPTRSKEIYDRIMLVLANLEDRLDGKEMSASEKKHLWDVKLRINRMRFDEPRKLEYQHWAALFNKINGMLGLEKRAPDAPRPGKEDELSAVEEEELIIKHLEQELGPPPGEQRE